MLKALELSGFKSFADATRFDFPDGITVVVGPNGSGKSNIVDAIKWVLGSQSAKSLRGGDMSDVIFKGSAAGGRKPANSAEATLVLDNAERKLGVDSDEVTVTRRVYRSGESEYLINRQPCRLRDVKDLFRGTGVGVDAYSLIEQGKVDRMLQASPKDRRAIFEEAAGISRFKAKKVEAERRLQRVNQSLLRLSDIVDEVGGRLSAIKSQASKAARYREMTGRLSRLRDLAGYAEDAEIARGSEALQAESEQTTAELDRLTAAASEAETDAAERKLQAQELQRCQQQLTVDHYAVENQANTLQAGQQHQRHRLAELGDEADVLRRQADSLRQRVDAAADQIASRQQELDTLRQTRERHEVDLDGEAASLNILSAACRLRRSVVETAGGELENYRRAHDAAQIEERSLRGERDASAERLARLAARAEAAEAEVAAAAAGRGTIDASLADAAQHKDSLEQQLAECRREVESRRGVLQSLRDDAIRLQARHQSLQDRLELLERLEAESGAIGEGARRLIEASRHDPVPPWDGIRGLVADLIEVEVHLAPLVDVALAHLSEAVVLADGRIVDMLQRQELKLDGRVTLLRLDRMPSRRAGDRIQLDGLRGVIGRADRLVHYDAAYEPLVQFLLGTTWLVDSLQTALDLSHYRGSGLRFVTAACERIDTDGTIHIGSLQTLSGILTRRSEMHAVADEAAHTLRLIDDSAAQAAAGQHKLDAAVAAEREAEAAVRSAERRCGEVRFELQQFDAHVLSQAEAARTLAAEAASQQTRLDEVELAIAAARTRADSAAAAVERQAVTIEILRESLAELQGDFDRRSDAIGQQRLAAAKLEHQLDSERLLLQSLHADRQEREQLIAENAAKLADVESRAAAAAASLATADAELAELDTRRQQLASQRTELQKLAGEAAEAAASADRQLSAATAAVLKTQQKIEEAARSFEQLKSRRDVLHQVYRDEHGIDLTADRSDDVEFIAEVAALDRGAANREINELRGDIAACGSVNMEALAELDDLQGRYDSLHGHYVDLTDARDNLLKIIERIDAKSKEMFLATLAAIRSNFQTLYRRSFGGGSADIILEDENDVLNCGVEVIATPPGKIALSNSLLSGGEKALTAVALIMSIFQFRPSPFCILDEVDAPFDEANIGRFVNVLKDFLDMTKFVVVSHSKKTMTVANTIYGVTMQESGVSRQVSVRFEEVSDDGEILSFEKAA